MNRPTYTPTTEDGRTGPECAFATMAALWILRQPDAELWRWDLAPRIAHPETALIRNAPEGLAGHLFHLGADAMRNQRAAL